MKSFIYQYFRYINSNKKILFIPKPKLFSYYQKYIKDQDFINWNKEILLSINNLELLCLECHNKEHMREKAFNANTEINLETGEYTINKK